MSLTVGYEGEAQCVKAKELAQQLHLAIDNTSSEQLLITAEKLCLKISPFGPVSIDFNRESWQKRRDEGKKQGLVRACKPKLGLRIIDATAGWGRDAAVLASFGADVLMLERNPVIAALLADALTRCTENERLPLTLANCDALTYLTRLTPKHYPDIIYIDPMHPTRQKSALVKKELQILQQLIGPDEDAIKLIKLARTRVLQKVVVKWPQQLLALLPPSASIAGKTIRFDIYLPILE